CSHWAGRVFGYSVIEMKGKEIFNEFYIAWMLNLAQTLDILMKNDRIHKLIDKLENLSIKDALTGLYNRRGFETRSRDMISALQAKTTVCTMVIDLDGLKRINDEHGHYEGDRAIKAAAEIIMSCCTSGEIAGRTGGDEFYVFAADYSENRLRKFINSMNAAIEKYNSESGRPYRLEVSYGTNLAEADSRGDLEELLKISDQRMYEQKQSKPARRR
ncbi:GGDEF domain-containing protein, partial [uncultured Ruminococcus sp.]|uniref:GGDEF domain-containing protein n=1 Tax=uncultured Ruminococcus sp. TaxID=165186 RepID=UPI0025D13591